MRSHRKYPNAALSKVLTLVTLSVMVSSGPAQNGTWITKSEMPTARWGASACTVIGEIYVLGGAGKDKNKPFGTIEVYNPQTDVWTTKVDMSIPNYLFSASVVNGKIYVIGGAEREWGFKASVEEYDPISENWTSKTDMPTARSAHAAAVIDGIIYVIGGSRGSNKLDLQTVEAYDPTADVWTQKANMPTGRSMLATSVVDGIIYAVGGTKAHFLALRTVEAYDPATDVWTSKATMPTPRVFPAAEAIQGNIYVIGGTLTSTLKSLNTVEGYNPVTNVWATKADMPTTRTAISSNTIDGKIYVVGGTSDILSFANVFATVEEYNANPTSVETGAARVPTAFVVHQNYPNPFNPATTIKYEVSKQARVVLKVMNLLGQEVRTLIDEDISPGFYEVTWDGRNNHGYRVASGVYGYKFEARDFVQTQKMVLIQ